MIEYMEAHSLRRILQTLILHGNLEAIDGLEGGLAAGFILLGSVSRNFKLATRHVARLTSSSTSDSISRASSRDYSGTDPRCTLAQQTASGSRGAVVE